jgi:archaellum component FlaC
MQYRFDKYQWQTLILRVKGLFSCGDVPAVTRMMESGINLPVIVRSGKVMSPGGNPLDELEVYEIEVDDDVVFEGRSSKDMRNRHDTIARFVHAIDETGDVTPDDLTALAKKDKNGQLTRLPPPAIRPPALPPQPTLPGIEPRTPEWLGELARLQGDIKFLKDMHATYETSIVDNHKRLQSLEQAMGEVRTQLANSRQVVSQARTELADLREKVRAIDEPELTGRINNLITTHDTTFEQLQNRLQEVEQAVAGLARGLREKQAVDRQVKSLKGDGDGAGR